MFKFSDIGGVLKGLAQGEMVVVVDDPNRENEGDLVMIAEKVTAESINFMAKYGRGLICMPLEEKLIKKLELAPMVSNNTDLYETAFTVSIDIDNGSTGISAYDRAQTILGAVSPDAEASRFKRPGHIFPLAAKKGGVLERRGHTEASVDLAKLAGCQGAAVICEIMNEDGTMARLPELMVFAEVHGLKLMTIEDLAAYRLSWLEQAATTKMPTSYGDFQAVGFVDQRNGAHHMALTLGDLSSSDLAVPVRIHSECLTGDVFGSKRCDCGQQLDLALISIAKAGRGVLIYLRQEGRGIGLINKLKCYELQEQGYDTVTANEALGFAADMREYSVAAEILKKLKIDQVDLMTNNPEKIQALEDEGIRVHRKQTTQIEIYPENKQYLQTKVEKMNHLMAQ